MQRMVSDGKNLSGKDNYVFLEATGKGHFVGVTQAVVQNEMAGSARATT